MNRLPRRALSALAFVLLAGTAPEALHAQLAVHGGIAASTFGGEDAEGADTRTGLHIGASWAFSFSRALGLRVGLDYTQKGAGGEGEIVGVGEGEAVLEVEYLELPLLLQYSLLEGSSVGLHVLAGPVVSFETGCTGRVSLAGETFSGDCGEETEDLDLGVAAGAGFSLPVASPVDITLEALYNFGLRSLNDEGDLKNRAFLIRAGARLALGG
ncbi:MAG: outer membrane beta-barrel protein [Gemmatimonadota bacterium]